jgi:hypothetical protein
VSDLPSKRVRLEDGIIGSAASSEDIPFANDITLLPDWQGAFPEVSPEPSIAKLKFIPDTEDCNVPPKNDVSLSSLTTVPVLFPDWRQEVFPDAPPNPSSFSLAFVPDSNESATPPFRNISSLIPTGGITLLPDWHGSSFPEISPQPSIVKIDFTPEFSGRSTPGKVASRVQLTLTALLPRRRKRQYSIKASGLTGRSRTTFTSDASQARCTTTCRGT